MSPIMQTSYWNLAESHEAPICPYMDIWEPHGFRPSSSMRSALWGSWNGDRSCWTSILFFADGQMASTFNRGLDNLTLTDQNRVTELTSHWAHSIQYIYAIGINNVRLSIRNSMKQIDSLVSLWYIRSGSRC